MKSFLIGALFLVTVSLAFSCSTSSNQTNTDLQTLVNWMSGSFSSSEQAIADTNFRDVHLQIATVWQSRKDGFWLYVEQAIAEKLERPYRQRIYHVTALDNGKFSSAVYEIPDPLRFAGARQSPELFDALTPDSLNGREGCAVILTKSDKQSFSGSTNGSDCLSSLYGAAYATSEVTITSDRLESWDRGWNAAGEQVWGSENGAYIFKRIAQHP